MVNILRLTVAYLNATINMKPETQNRRLEPTGLTNPGETRGLAGTGQGLARQESAGRFFGRFWNRTDPFLRSKPGPLAGYPDPLLTLLGRISTNSKRDDQHRLQTGRNMSGGDFGRRLYRVCFWAGFLFVISFLCHFAFRSCCFVCWLALTLRANSACYG